MTTVDVDEPTGSASIRRVQLPGDRELILRPIGRGDTDALAALYAGLDDEARHRRFFSHYRPPAEFFEKLVTVDERGGAGLVAELVGVRDDGRIVAEAGYELLPNHDGELAITVDAGWRGWLGPYLLDALVATAAAHGVPNLEADILVSNGPMIALVRSRGYAMMPRPDWSIMRVLIGAASRAPGWPPSHDGLRVLVEGSGGGWHADDAAGGAGLKVLGCAGPNRHAHCPALAGQPCPLAAGADAIVLAHPPDTEEWDVVRGSHALLHPGVPVCVELPREGDRGAPGETVVPAGTEVDVVAFVQRLAQRRPADEGETGPGS
jgi:RimJ/RimL family protein N-acetyltransferase